MPRQSAVPIAELTRQAMALIEQGSLPTAERMLKQALQAVPDDADALLALGVLCGMSGRLPEAVKHLRRAARAAPGNAPAHYNLGQALIRLGRHADAAESLTRAAKLDERAEIHEKLGDSLRQLGRLDEATSAYRRAVALDPANSLALSSLVETQRKICDWTGLAENEAAIVSAARAGKCVEPLLFQHVLDDPVLQRKVSETYWREMIAPQAPPPVRLRPPIAKAPRGKIKIAYLSADFRRHPMVSVIAEAIELHDRSRFEVWGYSYGLDDGSPERIRIQKAFDRFVDVSTLDDRALAARIAANGIDILIDLAGYTANARLGIVAARPAPVVCHYMGYPGTLGSPAFDYLIADAVVAPPGADGAYQEAIARLPVSYWAVDRKRRIDTPPPSRRDLGLPEDAVVLASFNGQQKLSPALMASWARILSAVPAAVLWLYSDNAVGARNLAACCAEMGIPNGRVVMAGREPPARHLARITLADIVLDTQPYGGHTTTCDALFVGVPVIALAGKSFASRVGASLVTAAGLPELTANSLVEVERAVIELASDPKHLQEIRSKLAQTKDRCALFDTARFTRHLETAYERMFTAAVKGERPQSFTVEPLPPTDDKM